MRDSKRNWRRKRHVTAALLLLAVGAVLVDQAGVEACGPDPPVAVFAATRHPDEIRTRFVAGELGVVLPSWYQRYLIFSFRQFAALPVDTLTRRLLLDPRPSRAEPRWDREWLAARMAVPGAVPLEWIEINRPVDPAEPYFSYRNINDDAFRNAIQTLGARIQSFGAASAEVRAWLEGQDSVFANYRSELALPPDPGDEAPSLLGADHAYQMAAAYFYGGHFEEAADRFDRIALDAGSPWQSLGPYLAARALVRKGTVIPEYGGLDTLALARAESRLEAILDDPSRSELHPVSRGLLSFVRLRLRPHLQLLDLCLRLTAAQLDSSAVMNIRDLTWLFDRVDREEVREFARENPEATLADWVLTFQAGDEESRQHALSQWRATGSLPWLVCAIARAKPTDDSAEGLLHAASALRPASAAYATLSFHRARLLAVMDPPRARALLDTLLADTAGWTPSAHNLLVSLRLRLDPDVDEFVRYAPRHPVGVATFGSGSRVHRDDSMLLEGRAFPGPDCLDLDGVYLLERGYSLEDWLRLAGEDRLPANIRAEIAVCGWVRAEIQEEEALASQFARRVRQVWPSLASEMDAYLAATEPASRRFAAVWTLLRFPGLRPRVSVGLGRLSPLGERDLFRDNWWCAVTDRRSADYLQRLSWLPAAAPIPLPPDSSLLIRLSQETDSAAHADQDFPAEAAPNLLGRGVLEWLEIEPQDPRLPEALHLAVQATRYGCSDSLTTSVSKACFQALHERYPESEWAARTKYWY